MPSTVNGIVSDLRVKLRDVGRRPENRRYTDANLLLFITNSLHRLYREERAAFFGITNAPAKIANMGMESDLPLVDASWYSRVMNDAVAEAENVNQEGTRPEVTGQQQREEILG